LFEKRWSIRVLRKDIFERVSLVIHEHLSFLLAEGVRQLAIIRI
jgi:hypothetical protein